MQNVSTTLIQVTIKIATPFQSFPLPHLIIICSTERYVDISLMADYPFACSNRTYSP